MFWVIMGQKDVSDIHTTPHTYTHLNKQHQFLLLQDFIQQRI